MLNPLPYNRANRLGCAPCMLSAWWLVLCAFAAPEVLADQPLLRIGSGELAPYVDRQRADGGHLVHLLGAVFAAAGYRVEYSHNPWNRNLLMLRQGQLDAVMPYACTRSQRDDFLCSEPLVRSDVVLFRRKGMDFHWQRVEDLNVYRLGTTLGFSYGPAFDAAQQSGLLKGERNAKDDAAFRLLLRGRIDLHPQDKAAGYALLQRSFTAEERAQIDHHPLSLSRETLHLLVRRGDPRAAELMRQFNLSLQGFAERGDLGRVQNALQRGHGDAWMPAGH